ncbi:protein-glutamate O-methyltransferase CheR [SAR92 clade bacterium H455]|uniref:protein-glutamate O-methyltransferase n=1 Tax=SAR92 clade bacterium H455 TaxID=2974818 RepID=A0ABY5TQZ8_9GAMM|nr:protein-glutamate O-methyltransferase CheR [SAR92 clade bacterium H455]
MAIKADQARLQNSEFGYFDIWKTAIEERTGVQISADRERVLGSLLNRRMIELDLLDVDEYLTQALDVTRGAEEWSGLVDSLLVKETSFFRHAPSFDYVAQWVKETVTAPDFAGPLWLWSLGCSTGEEAYSLAITVDRAMRGLGCEAGFGIIGTDISNQAISQARRGIYRGAKMNALDKPTRAAYFDQVGKQLWRIKADLRRRVCFLTSNILADKSPLIGRKMHLIYCQNMLIYFRRWKRRELVNQLTDHLDSRGCLILGLGELANWTPEGLSRVAPRVVQAYTKVETVEQGEAL